MTYECVYTIRINNDTLIDLYRILKFDLFVDDKIHKNQHVVLDTSFIGQKIKKGAYRLISVINETEPMKNVYKLERIEYNEN